MEVRYIEINNTNIAINEITNDYIEPRADRGLHSMTMTTDKCVLNVRIYRHGLLAIRRC